MSIVNELMSGTVKFIVGEDGSEQIERRPPTALVIRAANTIKTLQATNENLIRAFHALEQSFTRNIEEYQKLYEKCSVVPEHVADEGIDSVRSVHGDAEEPRSEDQTGQTP